MLIPNRLSLPGGRSRPIVQMCWAVEDIPTAVARWVATAGAGPFFLASHIPFDDLTYRGRPGVHFDQSSAVGQWGDLQVELLQQHCDNPSGVQDMRLAGERGLNHVTWFAEDIEREGHRLTSLGFAEVMTARLPTMADMRIAWYDTRPWLGCMLEVYEESDLMRRFYRKVARAASGWNGTDPLRSLGETRSS